MHKWWANNVTVTLETYDIIGQIPTSDLENELKKRKDLQLNDQESFKKEERMRRSDCIEVEIDPEDYDLIAKEDIELSDFSESEIADYLKRIKGYRVFGKGEFIYGGVAEIKEYFDRLVNFQYRDIICDILGISQLSTVDDITNKLKEKIS